MGGLTVRSLTDEEKVRVRKILQDLQEHVSGCERCQQASSSPRDLCLAGAELYARWDKWLEDDRIGKTCVKCGKPGDAICFDCFMDRPFERDIICNVCGVEKPIVRLYLSGPACDDCAPAKRLVPSQ